MINCSESANPGIGEVLWMVVACAVRTDRLIPRVRQPTSRHVTKHDRRARVGLPRPQIPSSHRVDLGANARLSRRMITS